MQCYKIVKMFQHCDSNKFYFTFPQERETAKTIVVAIVVRELSTERSLEKRQYKQIQKMKQRDL